MSKQSEAKEAQGFVKKPIYNTCGNCANFSSELAVKPNFWGSTYTQETQKFCSLGGFATGRAATCSKWEK